MRSFSYYWKEGFRNIFAHGFMSIAAIAIMLACLLLTGTITLIAHNINLNIIDLQQKSQIVVFIEETLTTREAELQVGRGLGRLPNVGSMKFQSRDEALESYRLELGDDASILDIYDSTNNPLRNSYVLTLKDPMAADQTIAEIEAVDGVAKVRADEDTIAKLVQIQRVFNIVALAMVIAISVISIFIIANTVKLAMFARREEISIQKMVGATNWFIRWPFMIEGMVLGLLAGVLAFFAQWGVYTEMANIVSGVIPLLDMVPFDQLRWIVLAVFAGAGVLFGIGGSVTSIRKFMNV